MKTLVIVTVSWLLWAGPVVAGTCTPISSVPQTLSNGSYCLNFDVGVGGQPAFTLQADAVLDCKGHRIYDLTGGTGTGVLATGDNITIKNCVVAGFREPITISGSDGYRLSNNKVEGTSATSRGIAAYGADNGVISNNRIINKAPLTQHYWGIFVNSGTVDVIANTVSNAIAAPGSGASMYGIYSNYNNGGLIGGNLIRNVIPDVGQQGISVAVQYGRSILRDNTLVNLKGGDLSYFCYQGQYQVIDGFDLGSSRRNC